MKLIKFSSKPEYLRDLAYGKIYMKSVNFFRTLEKAEQGDKTDGIVTLFQPKLKIKDDKSGKYVPIKGLGPLNFTSGQNYPIFCMSMIDEENLNDEKFLKLFKENFGSYFLMFENIDDFSKTVDNYCKNNNYRYAQKPVIYINFDKMDDSQLIGINLLEDGCFIKDSSFEKQKEYRFVIKNDYIIPEDKDHIVIDLNKKFKCSIFEITDKYECKCIEKLN